MNEVTVRYSKITEKFPREFILIQGKGCFWKKCKFCDYFEDVSKDSFELNSSVIEQVTGEFGILDVINSGSAMELDTKTIELLINKVKEKKIREIWFEAHWAYRNKLKDFAKKFDGISVKFRTGIETFNTNMRNYWNKGIPENISAKEVSDYFQSVNLLIGVEGQTFDDIVKDIRLADTYFERYIINVFVKNSTSIRPDNNLIRRFLNEVYPNIKNNPKVEILIENTDLGVG